MLSPVNPDVRYQSTYPRNRYEGAHYVPQWKPKSGALTLGILGACRVLNTEYKKQEIKGNMHLGQNFLGGLPLAPL